MKEDDKAVEEELELMAIVDSEIESLTVEDNKRYLQEVRYKQIVEATKTIALQIQELRSRKIEKSLPQLYDALRDVMGQRRWIVKELRLMGERVDDKYVPLS